MKRDRSGIQVSEMDTNEALDKASGLFKEKRFEEAISLAEEVIGAEPLNARAWDQKGNALFELGKHEEALACFDKVTVFDPAYLDAYGWNGKGNALFGLKKYRLAIDCYERAIKVDPEFVWAWRNKGQALLNLDMYQEALMCYDRALELDPNDISALIDKGWTLDKLGERPAAIDLYDRAIQIDPSSTNAWLNKGWTLYNDYNYAESLDCFENALEIDPNNIDAWNYKGNSLLNLGDYDAAIRCYEKVVELDPNYVWGWSNKGVALVNQGKLDESKPYFLKAIEICEKALEENPRSSAHWTVIGTASRYLGDYSKAIQAYTEVLNIEPNNVDTMLDLCFIYSDNTLEPDKAMVMLQRALQIKPDDFITRLNYVEALLKNENYLDARQEALKVLPRASDDRDRCLLRYFIFASYVYESNLDAISREFNDFTRYYQELPHDFTIRELSYSFTGMIDAIDKGALNPLAKFMLLTLIDLLQGKISRQELSFFVANPRVG
jgi:tetratricopeptide (TPR) repeat protein